MTETSESGVLVLDVKSSRDHEIGEGGARSVPHRLRAQEYGWRVCVEWCQSQYGKRITTPAAQMLVELVGPTMGVLDQELQKLKDFVGDRAAIDVKDVDELTGRSRGANVFKILDDVGEGQQAAALKILTELFEEGEEPLKLLGALGFQLRKLARAARMHKQGMNLDEAMTSGCQLAASPRQRSQGAPRHDRLDKLYDCMLELDGV
jgi:DNA polymerase-3 subunit delta